MMNKLEDFKLLVENNSIFMGGGKTPEPETVLYLKSEFPLP